MEPRRASEWAPAVCNAGNLAETKLAGGTREIYYLGTHLAGATVQADDNDEATR